MRELTDRQKTILNLVADGYLRDGEPVGSKAVMGAMGNVCSSATIRNEMAEMERLGYLGHPHTSAGRVPTAQGLRYYIDRLMRARPLTSREKRVIDERVVPFGPDPSALARKASEVISALTGHACVVVSPAMGEARIERIDLFFVRRGIWGVALTTSGGIHSAICRLAVDRETGAWLSAVLTKVFRGVCLREINTALLQSSLIHLGPHGLSCFGLLDTIRQLAVSLRDSKVVVDGHPVLMQDTDTRRARRIMELLGSDRELKKLFPVTEEVTVVLGDELDASVLGGIGAVYTGYRQGEDLMGSIGVIGPMRMDYKKATATLSYMSDLLGHVMSRDL